MTLLQALFVSGVVVVVGIFLIITIYTIFDEVDDDE